MTSPHSIRLSLIANPGTSLEVSSGRESLSNQTVLGRAVIALPDDLRSLAGQTQDGPRTQKRSDQAVNAHWEEHLDVVYRYALRLTRDNQLAHELTQETMLRGWRRQTALRESAAARVWLLRIATNIWTDWQRRNVLEPRLLQEPPPSRGPTSIEKLIHQENVMLALATLDQLPPRQRQVMHLITVEEMSQDEVAAILGTSVRAVKASLCAGRKEMRERLRGVYEEVCGKKRCQTEK